ncbi:sensor histidine kinase [Brevundimonas diminuta]|uniref:sensor histidine kinase n=1 Tax=Brevundimonas diminuta TaxID=293 RepID=UPI003F8027FF
MWGALTGAALAAVWLGVLNARMWDRRPPASVAAASPDEGEAMALRVLLDAAPTPLVGVEGTTARALNRAARDLFSAEDRILPPPPALFDREVAHFRQSGRRWRLDRVELASEGGSSLAALIDVEQEERVAEVRVTAELVEVLGHELLNGLAPIASLSESALDVLNGAHDDPDLLREILGVLARRADGLQRFAEVYRTLARLPEPIRRPVSVREMADDLARLFASRWPAATLHVNAQEDLSWALDRDQMHQAVWALLQNAAEATQVDGPPSGTVRLSVKRVDETLVIEVADDGPGVSSADAERIFRPFVTTKPNGSGIGLSLARQIAHAHGGALTLERTPATVFRLSLP